jgi:hypothetical protein
MRHILHNDIAFSLVRVMLAVGSTLFIAVILLRPELQTIAGIPVLKIAAQYHMSLLGHVVVFGLLFLTWCWALVPHFHPTTAPMIAFLIVIILATVGEYLQTFIAGRYSSPADMTANLVGLIGAWWLWRALPSAYNQRLELLFQFP